MQQKHNTKVGVRINIMAHFRTTTHLSAILDASYTEPVIIFKYSAECNTSAALKKEFEGAFAKNKLHAPVYVVVVQDHPALSKKITEMFDITHESPQIIIVNKGQVTYTAHHKAIHIKDFKFT